MAIPGQLVGKFVAGINDSDWRDLMNHVSSEYQFQNPNWYSSWASKYLPLEFVKTNIEYASITDDTNRLRAVLPFIITSKYGVKVISTAGYYYPFRSFLHSDNLTSDCAEALVKSIDLGMKENIVRFGPADEEAPINNYLKKIFTKYGWMCQEIKRGTQQIITLPDTIEEYNQSLSKGKLKNLKRRQRKLREAGNLTLEKHNGDTYTDWCQVIDHCAEIESKSWLVANDGKLRIKGKEEFWKKYLEKHDSQKRLSVWLVKLNSRPIAYSLAIDSGLTRYSISGQYDEEYKKFGVGLMADYEMLKDSIICNLKTVNLGDGEADYKKCWGARSGSQLVDYIYFRPNLIGHIIYLMFGYLKSI